MKVGFGYDIHRLVEKEQKKEGVLLGGIKIPFRKKLSGYSDADVLIHSLCDAMLGAIGKGDLGTHFPDTVPEFKNISSIKLLKKVKTWINENYRIVNIDSSLILEKPNIQNYKFEIEKNIAHNLDIDSHQVNVKASTKEGLGSIGKGKAIASYCIVLLE